MIDARTAIHVVTLLFIGVHSWATVAQARAAKPNILFIFADDQSYETVAAHGNTEVKTPHLDRLATSGVSFANAYNMGAWNGAVCIASRAMLNTGRMVWRAHAVDTRLERLAAKGEMWSQMLKKAVASSAKTSLQCLPPSQNPPKD